MGDESTKDAAGTRKAFLGRNPTPSNVITAFAVAPGIAAWHEGVGRNYDFGKQKMGHVMSELGLLQSEYAKNIIEDWKSKQEEEGVILQYHTSFFVEAFVHSL